VGHHRRLWIGIATSGAAGVGLWVGAGLALLLGSDVAAILLALAGLIVLMLAALSAFVSVLVLQPAPVSAQRGSSGHWFFWYLRLIERPPPAPPDPDCQPRYRDQNASR
jgi:hypothetical protein